MFYITANNAVGFQLPHIQSICSYPFYYCHPRGCEMGNSLWFDLYFPEA